MEMAKSEPNKKNHLGSLYFRLWKYLTLLDFEVNNKNIDKKIEDNYIVITNIFFIIFWILVLVFPASWSNRNEIETILFRDDGGGEKLRNERSRGARFGYVTASEAALCAIYFMFPLRAMTIPFVFDFSFNVVKKKFK